MLKSAKKFPRLCAVPNKFFICVLLLVVFVGSSKADTSSTDGTTPSVITPGAPAGSYPLGDLDNINLFNGSLNFALPLMRVRGRGEAGYTMMLPIESHWRVLDRSNDYQEIFVPTDFTWYADKPGYGPGLLLGRAVATNLSGDGSACFPYSSGNSYQSLIRLTFILPDGTEYEFRDQNTGGQRVTSSCSGAGYNRGTVFVTADGTSATFIADSNSPIHRYYDGVRDGNFTNISNVKGRLWQTETSGANGSRTTVTSYDALGRPLIQIQEFKTNNVWGSAYQLQRGSGAVPAYDLAGHVRSQVYPSGHSVTYNYDNAGRLGDKDSQNLAFSGNLGEGGASRTYSRGITYSPRGGMSQEQFGTDTPIYNKLFYNSRGQLAEIREGINPNDTGWERGAIINFYATCWGMCGGENSTTQMIGNNGNLKRQEIYIPGGPMFAQTFAYDSLNRLQSVSEDASWGQGYIYDRYGNRRIDLDPAKTFGAGINNKDFTVNTANNRLGVPSGQSGVMSYDNAGNLTTDTYSAAAVTRAYDAENRMTSETQANSYVAGSYTYNADGQRVRRKVNGVETWQVYGMEGELLAEYAANASATSPQKEYGYRNGQLLITAEPPTGQAPPLNPQSVSWTNVTSTIQVTGNSIQKTSGTNAWDAGAVSSQMITAGDGYMEFTPGDTGTWRMCGLGNTDSSVYYADIEYAFFIYEGGGLQIYESGNARGSFGTYAAGDRLKVAVEGGVVKYYRNGSLLYTSTVAPTYPLQVDTSLNTVNAGVYNVVITSTTPSATGNINWLVTDQLGTPRMIFDKTGALATVKRHDYLPFGEELFAGTGARTPTLGYSAADGVRQKFTRKERDNETGLDYFLARYYSSTQGRFTSPDEFTGGPDELYEFADDASDNPTFYADLTNPQSLNKYQYTYNDPLNLTDDDGHCPICVVVVVVAVEILLAPDTVNAPGPNDRTYPSGDGVKTLMANATVGVIGGPLLSKGSRSLLKFAAGREATEVVGEAAAKGGRTEAKIPSGQRVKPPTKNQRQAVYAANRAKNSGELKCEICGNKMTPAKKSAKGVSPKPNEATLDHIKPRSRGGTNEPKNLRPACRKCNRDKSDND